MTARDLIEVSIGNLRRMKLRTFLTVSGVIIAIAAFVAMLSFGAGNQRHITEQFEKLGLFSTMQVYPAKAGENGDTTKAAMLDQAALTKLATLPGVRLAYPYQAFTVTAKLGEAEIPTKAQALPETAIKTRLFSQMLAGKAFDGDTGSAVIVTSRLLKEFKIESPDSVIGRQLVVSMRVSSLDSGMAHILSDGKTTLQDRLEKIEFDSLFDREYRRRTIRTEVNHTVKRFLDGFLNARDIISDTFTIGGVLDMGEGRRIHIEPIVMPLAAASHFSTGGFTGNPADLLPFLTGGNFLGGIEPSDSATYSEITLDLDPKHPYKAVGDSVKAMGFQYFSFAEQFSEIQKFFIYFDLGLGIIGLIALVTASLGIINTMVMSIMERRREIGVLKSLGADDADIRKLFLVESGVIGTIGASVGVLFGWLISRTTSAVAQMFMRREGIPPVELFALPYWLILIALAIGVGVSLLAGLYPAARAARVDPVEALRGE